MSYQFTNNLPNVLTGSTNGIGNMFSDIFLGTNSIGQRENLQMLNEQNRFNEYMSSTNYQRGIADMKAAGINPMVAMSNGASGSPSASSGSGGNSKFTGGILGKELATTVNSFMNNIDFTRQKDQAIKILGAIL